METSIGQSFVVKAILLKSYIKSCLKSVKFRLYRSVSIDCVTQPAQGEYYKDLFSRYQYGGDAYCNLIKFTDVKEKAESKNKISFSGQTEFGSSVSDFLNNEVSKKLHIKKIKTADTLIVFYRCVCGGEKTRIESHFYNNKLFFYKYTFPYISESGKDKILDVIKNKYGIGNKVFNDDKLIFSDSQGNFVCIYDCVEFSISYWNSSDAYFSRLNSDMIFQNQKQTKKEISKGQSLFFRL
jgi:hypothetical protein